MESDEDVLIRMGIIPLVLHVSYPFFLIRPVIE